MLFLQLSERIYKSLDVATKTLRFTVPFPMLAYPFYLVSVWVTWLVRFERRVLEITCKILINLFLAVE